MILVPKNFLELFIAWLVVTVSHALTARGVPNHSLGSQAFGETNQAVQTEVYNEKSRHSALDKIIIYDFGSHYIPNLFL
jgi:hypothetical protein